MQDPNYSNVTMPTSFYFGSCAGYLNSGSPINSDGCFAGQNETGSPITSLTLSFGTNDALDAAGGAAAAIGRGDLFTSASTSATTDPVFYTLTFSGGGIGNNVFFIVTEDGLDPSAFPQVSLTYTNATPEPSSLVLFATSLLGFGWMYRRYSLA
ncbi:hypothetical protein GCM10022270_07990 [Terriglobus aquaticus]